MKKLISLTLAASMLLGSAAALAETNVTFSWWGGDARHEATQNAVAAFEAANPDIKVATTYAAWSGWEDKMSQAFAANSAQDMNQVNWNWLYSMVNADGTSKFQDLNAYADVIDLTQFNASSLAQCTIDGQLLAIPVAMTGRILYWNETTFQAAGLETPKTYADLLAAGPIFEEKLGKDYYPLVMGTLDKTIFMVYYLESVYGKDWVTDGQMNYTKDEIKEGIQFIQNLEDNHVIPTCEKLIGDGADSLDKNTNWMDGHYAGIFEWDSSATKFRSALNEGQTMVVGDYFADFGAYQGGFTKVSLGFAITATAADDAKAASAKLIQYLCNDDEGIRLMNSQRGIPLSTAAFNLCNSEGLLDPMVAEANQKVLAWCQNALDPKFESSKLKSSDGVYNDVFEGLSYGDYDVDSAADTLIAGIQDVLGA